MSDKKNPLSTNNIVWLVVIVLVIAAIIVLIIVRSDDDKSAEEQAANNHNVFKWLVGIGAAGIVLFVLWSQGYISMKTVKKSDQEVQEFGYHGGERSPSRGSHPANLRSSSRGVRKMGGRGSISYNE